MSPGGFLNGNPNFMLPHYFSFGEYEKDVIKRYQIKCKEIYNIGSLKAGIFLDNHHESILQTDSICLISQHWMIKDDEVKIKAMFRKTDKIAINVNMKKQDRKWLVTESSAG